MGQKTDNKVMKQMQNLWNQKPNNRQHLSNDEINDMLSSDERVDKLYNMMKGKINEIGDTENGMYAIGQVAGRAYDRMLNSPRNKKVDGVVALDPKYGKVAQDAAYAGAGGYIQWQKNFEKVNGHKPSDKERQAYMQNYHNGVNDYGKPESERKGIIKLSESQLHSVIAESVKKVIKEYGYDAVPESGYEEFNTLGEHAAYWIMNELRKYSDLDSECISHIIDGFTLALKTLADVGDIDNGVRGFGIKS